MKKTKTKRMVIYDQFHWLSPDRPVVPVSGTKEEILGVYQFYKDCYPEKILRLVDAEEFKNKNTKI